MSWHYSCLSLMWPAYVSVVVSIVSGHGLCLYFLLYCTHVPCAVKCSIFCRQTISFAFIFGFIVRRSFVLYIKMFHLWAAACQYVYIIVCQVDKWLALLLFWALLYACLLCYKDVPSFGNNLLDIAIWSMSYCTYFIWCPLYRFVMIIGKL